QHIYGSARLGVDRRNVDMIAASTPSDNVTLAVKRGEKHYELSNHLGNVLATVSDKKIAVMSGVNLSYYRADVVSYSDYYPFGAPMTERTAVVTPTDVRYGFNGKEVDSEINGNGNAYDFGSRMYDARLGRWWSVDAKVVKYPAFSSFSGFGNNPNIYIDIEGEENIVYLVYIESKESKKCRLSKAEKKSIEKAVNRQFDRMMTKTKVVIYQGTEPFDPSNLDKTDTFFLIGAAKDIKAYDEKNKLGDKIPKDKNGKAIHRYDVDYKHLVDDKDVFETTSSGSGDPSVYPGGIGGGFDIGRIRDFAKKVNISFEDAMVLTIVHSAFGHNTNYVKGDHSCEAPVGFDGCRLAVMLNISLMCAVDAALFTNGSLSKKNAELNTVDEICFESAMEVKFYQFIQKRFGTKKASDNYEKNKKKG
ncbi:MAG: RHS repeat domain-containing protein, partial [Flavobacteriales bacterium]